MTKGIDRAVDPVRPKEGDPNELYYLRGLVWGLDEGKRLALNKVKELVQSIEANYPEDIFEPLKKEDIMPSRDRVSAQMARHICDRILEELK